MENVQLLLLLTLIGLATSTPLPQGDSEEGYRLQSPERTPSGIYNVPTVPPPLPTGPSISSPVDQLYTAPQQQRQAEQFPSAAQQSQVLEQIPETSVRDGASISAQPSQSPSETAVGMPYEFEWSVNDVENGLVYSHQENSDGTVAQGEYRVLLPDGRLQIVTFEDRGQGYQAQVTYQDYNL